MIKLSYWLHTIAYAGRSELVSLEIQDVLIDEKNKGVKLRLRKSKTDPHATGRSLFLNTITQEALKDWIAKSEIQSGKLFRAITRFGKIKEDLHAAEINRTFKRLAYLSKADSKVITEISGHSMRVGAAQDLMKSGASLPIIMNRGRWSKTDTVMRYIEFFKDQ